MNRNEYPRLAGKVVLITGAWGGLGRTFARHLLASGAKLILSDLTEKPLASLAEKGDLPAGWEQNVLGQIVADLNAVSGPKTIHEACRKISEVDVVIHNAGLSCIGYFDDIPIDKMNLQLRVMLTAPMELTHLFLPDFIRRGSGQFVFVSSVAGFIATSLGASYSAAKFGIRAFAMALAGEIRPRGLDVTIIYPFFTRTGFMKSPVFGRAQIPKMPGIFIDEPDDVVHKALRAVDRRRLHVRPGFYSKLMWQAQRLWPVTSTLMQPKGI